MGHSGALGRISMAKLIHAKACAPYFIICLRVAIAIGFVGPITFVAGLAAATRADELYPAPFWQCRVATESALFVSEDQRPAFARLMFRPIGPVSIRREGASGPSAVFFVEGRDYVVDRTARRVTLVQHGTVPFVQQSELRVPANRAASFLRSKDVAGQALFLSEDGFFNREQVTISYRHRRDRWPGTTPKFAPSGLPRTIARLRSTNPVKIMLVGDSISEGYNASAHLKMVPMRPPYADQVVAGLRAAYHNDVTLTNRAHAGWKSSQGLAQVTNESLDDARPDLIVIAFGMNDAAEVSAIDFAKNVAAIMAAFQRKNPYSEYILVSPMLPNPNWAFVSDQRYVEYRNALRVMQKRGVIVADMTSLWTAILGRKSFYDVTGNGVNHPNDFGHSLYAQTILAMLVPPDRIRRLTSFKC